MPHGGRHDADERFTVFYREHHPSIQAYVARRCADSELVSQAVAETFTVAWRRLDDALRGGRPWLIRTARLSLNNALRTERRQVRVASRTAAHDDRSVGDTTGDSATLELLHVRDVLSTLSELDRELLMLAYWDDLAVAEIAQALSCATGTAAVRLHRARGRFRRALSLGGPATDNEPSTDLPDPATPTASRKENLR